MQDSPSFENTDLVTFDFLVSDVPLTGCVSSDFFVGLGLLGWVLYKHPPHLKQWVKHFLSVLHRKHIIAFSPRASRLSQYHYPDL